MSHTPIGSAHTAESSNPRDRFLPVITEQADNLAVQPPGSRSTAMSKRKKPRPRQRQTGTRFLDTQAVADLFGVSVIAIRDWHRAGDLPPGRRLRGRWWWTQAALDDHFGQE